MTAMPRLSSEPQTDRGELALDKRKSDRKIASGSISVESSTGLATEAIFRDVSAYGCNIQADAEWLRMGKFVTLRLGKSRQIPAIVRWSRDSVIGLEFLRPIPSHEADIIEEYIGK
jgi:PilZ domain